MIYGNEGAGLVDINIPQSPLYQQALPNLKEISASAWGLPSLDDIKVPQVELEKDIQTETELTDHYYTLAQQVRDYAAKGKSVGIDVTKPKNNPTHLQYAQEWNKMYNEFVQTGKELKNAKQNIATYNKAQTNPNAIVGQPDFTQVFDTEQLRQNTLEDPFAKVKGLQQSYRGLKPIYDDATYGQFLDKWKYDTKMIVDQTEALAQAHPQLADQIRQQGSQISESLFPPMVDTKFRAKLDQDMWKFKQSLALGYANLGVRKDALDYKKESDVVAGGQFDAATQQLINTPNTAFGNFGIVEANSMGKAVFIPQTAITVSGVDLPKHKVTLLNGPDGVKYKPNPDQKYIVIKDNDNKVVKIYPVNEVGIASFAAKYQQGYDFVENQNKNQGGTFDFEQSQDGEFTVTPNQSNLPVGKTTKGATSTTKKSTTTKTGTKYKGVPAGGF